MLVCNSSVPFPLVRAVALRLRSTFSFIPHARRRGAGTPAKPSRWLGLIYTIAILTALMLAFIAWSAVFRLRHDRIKMERELTRGKFAFRPKERARLLLKRSFPVAEGKPHWEDPLVSNLRKD